MSVRISSVETASQLSGSIAALPPLPTTAQKILTCFGDEFIDAAKVGTVVESDPGICAKLLGLANSAYFGLAEPVNSISEAISRVLGVDTVRSLVLAMAIQQSFSSKECPAFDVERYWLHSLLVAECCKRIVAVDELASDSDRDLAYTTGLCHNLGLMALVYMDPAGLNTALTRHRNQSVDGTLSHFLVEQINTDHKLMTAELSRVWSLPPSMITAFECREDAEINCDSRLGMVVSAAVVAVENTALEEDERLGLDVWAELFSIDVDDLQAMATVGDRQQERIESLASNMSR